MDVHPDAALDASRLRARGLRVTGPRLAILAMLQQIGGHRSADELVAALREGGYHHARTTVYNALDDLARAGLVRAAPVDAGALRYETIGEKHHHFVCRSCGLIVNVPVADDLDGRPLPAVEGARVDQLDVIYRGLCVACQRSATDGATGATGQATAGFSQSTPAPQGPSAAPPGGTGDDRDDDDGTPMYAAMRAFG